MLVHLGFQIFWLQGCYKDYADITTPNPAKPEAPCTSDKLCSPVYALSAVSQQRTPRAFAILVFTGTLGSEWDSTSSELQQASPVPGNDPSHSSPSLHLSQPASLDGK